MADQPLILIAFTVLWLASAYLLGLGLVAVSRPAVAVTFLSSFAQTPRANWIEALVRAAVGLAFVCAAPELPFSTLVEVGGWFLVVTAVAMLLLPSVHQRIATRSVAAIAPHVRLVGLGAVAGAAGLCALLLSRLH